VSAAYAEWMVRGRNHQLEGRPVDAMLCFQRAMREDRHAVDARFHLGEVLWQMGRLPDAIVCWRDAARIAPEHRPAQMALAEALLGTGDAAGARTVAATVAARHARNQRSRAIVAVAGLAAGSAAEPADAAAAVAATLAEAPNLLTVPAIAGSLARAVDRIDDPALTAPIFAAIAALAPDLPRVAAMPALLLAQTCERLAGAGANVPLSAWLDAAAARAWAPADHDALRRIARVAGAAGHGAAADLGRHHAALCMRAEVGAVPLAWPRRTRGERVRVVVLENAQSPAIAAPGALAAIENLPRERFDVARLTIGTVAADEAARLAGFDPDVVVDCVGLTAPVGPLLAKRPARLALSAVAAASANRAPLVDRDVADGAALAAALDSLLAAPADAAGMPAAGELAALWSDAVAAHRGGKRDAAAHGYRAVLALQPGFAQAHYLLGTALREAGDAAAARAAFDAALAAAPGYTDARVAAIRLAIDDGDRGAALALADAAGPIDAATPAALLRACASARLAAGDGHGAAALFETALAREPLDGETHYNHGVALQMVRRNADAGRAYQRALTFRPDLAAAEFNLGLLFAEEGNADSAIRAFTHVLEREPAHVAAYKHLSEMLFAAGRFTEWRRNFERFEARCPDSLALAVLGIEFGQHAGDLQRVERYLDGLRKEAYRAAGERELIDALEELLPVLLYVDVEPELIRRFERTYDDAARRVHGPPLVLPAQRRPGKLRIGYVSADLRNHVMGKMMYQAIEHHDRARFELHFYSLSDQRDAWTERFEALADGFTALASVSDRAAAETIARDDIDVLVDLSTHTKGARPGIFALKPARVALTHIASAGKLGLSTIDFKLTDAYCDVQDGAPPPAEALLPMAGCVYPYRHIAPAAGAPGYDRGTLGLAPDAVVIGAFVNSLKLSRRCLALWRDVLGRLPSARLAFSPVSAAWKDLYVRKAAAAGISPERLVFVPQGPDEAHNQARYGIVDFVLDPMPYGGVNGTLEALDMGVPVVTLQGRRHGERTSMSILANLGVTQTVAQTGKEYVELAVRLATDAAFMGETRAAIRRGLAASPLVDMRAHARHLEAAYLDALQRAAARTTAAAVAERP